MPGAVVARGERVVLRTREPEDVEFAQRGLANPEIRYPMGNPVVSRGELEEGAFESDSDRMVVCLEEDLPGGSPEETERIGTVNVDEADWRRPEISYWIAPEYQLQGYGREAIELLVEYVFRTYSHPGVEARVFDYNEASRGLLESLGFTQEGHLRKRRFIDGEYRDLYQYGLLREEWDGPP